MIAEISGVRVRVLDYGPGEGDDAPGAEGHILLCVRGVARVELACGRMVVLGPGMSCRLRAEDQPHRAHTYTGAILFRID